MKSLFIRNDLRIALMYAVVTGTGITIFDYLLAESSQSASPQSLTETFISWAFVTAFSLGVFFISHEELLRGPRIENEPYPGQDELKTVLRCLPLMILSVDRKGKLIYAEGQGLKQAGFEPTEIIGDPASRFYESFVAGRQPDKAISWKQLTERVFAGETVATTTEWNGRYYENRFSAIQNHSAHVNGIGWVVIDVTEHKRDEEALLNIARRYERLSESFPNGTVTVFDRDLRIRFVAGSELKKSGIPAESFLGKTFQEVSPVETFEIAQPHLLAALEGSSGSYETPYWNNRHYLVNVVPLADDNGSIQQIMLVTQNITSRKKMEEELREAELRYRTLVEQVPPIIYTTGWQQYIGVTYISPRIQMLGFTQEEWVADPELWLRQLHPEDRQRVLDQIEDIKKHDKPIKLEYRLLARDGTVRWFLDEVMNVSREDGKFLFRQGIMLDITDRKQAEQELRRSRDQLAHLSRRLVEAHERERRAIARELHDQLGQMLTSIRITLNILPKLRPELAAKKIQRTREITDELLTRVSRLSLELRPYLLDDLGLLPALRWYVSQFQEQSNIEVDFRSEGVEGQRFSPETETTAYRIIQEALTNAARHAHASRILLQLQAGNGQLEIHIQDDGQGFDRDSAFAKNHGLNGMRERVNLMSGSFRVETQPGSGTDILVQLPLKETVG